MRIANSCASLMGNVVALFSAKSCRLPFGKCTDERHGAHIRLVVRIEGRRRVGEPDRRVIRARVREQVLAKTIAQHRILDLRLEIEHRERAAQHDALRMRATPERSMLIVGEPFLRMQNPAHDFLDVLVLRRQQALEDLHVRRGLRWAVCSPLLGRRLRLVDAHGATGASSLCSVRAAVRSAVP